MTVENVITSVLGTEGFSQYEQRVYEQHQAMAEREIITQLNVLLSDALYLILLKQWGTGCACRFLEYREITVRLKSGQQWKVCSPVFLRAKSKEPTHKLGN